MIELESDAYTMNEDETKSLKVKRVGGTKGEIKSKIAAESRHGNSG